MYDPDAVGLGVLAPDAEGVDSEGCPWTARRAGRRESNFCFRTGGNALRRKERSWDDAGFCVEVTENSYYRCFS